MKVELLKALRARFEITRGLNIDDFEKDRYTVQFKERLPDFSKSDPSKNKVFVGIRVYHVKVKNNPVSPIEDMSISLFIESVSTGKTKEFVTESLLRRFSIRDNRYLKMQNGFK